MRQHIASVLADLETLTPMADLALREISYNVTTDGKIVEQPRFGIALPPPSASVRGTVRPRLPFGPWGSSLRLGAA